MTKKAKAIADLFAISNLQLCDIEDIVAIMETYMERNGLKYKEAKDIDPEFFIHDIDDMSHSFGEEINSMKHNKLDWFARSVEGWIDLEPLLKKDNEARYGVVATARKEGEVIIINPTSKK